MKKLQELILFLIAPCLHAKVMMTHHSNKHKGENKQWNLLKVLN